MSICASPFTQFAERLLADIGVDPSEIPCIINKFQIVINTFNQDKPTNTLTDIANDLYQCLKPNINDVASISAQELSVTFIYVVVLTAVFVILVVIVLLLFDESTRYGWELSIVIVIALLYIAGVVLLVFNARSIIDARLATAQNQVTACVNAAMNELNQFIATENLAVQNALCSYPAMCPTETVLPYIIPTNPSKEGGLKQVNANIDYALWDEQVLPQYRIKREIYK